MSDLSSGWHLTLYLSLKITKHRTFFFLEDSWRKYLACHKKKYSTCHEARLFRWARSQVCLQEREGEGGQCFMCTSLFYLACGMLTKRIHHNLVWIFKIHGDSYWINRENATLINLKCFADTCDTLQAEACNALVNTHTHSARTYT